MDAFDILVRNALLQDANWQSLTSHNTHGIPTAIKETQSELVLEIAVVGAQESDLQIEIEGPLLRVRRLKSEDNTQWLQNTIQRKAFELQWRFHQKWALDQAQVELKAGLLRIKVPSTPDSTPKRLSIQTT